jgi:GGDEF domain-containing protein
MIQLPSLDSDNILSLLHLIPVGIFLVNSDNRIIWVNKTLCDQVGLEARQLVGHMRSDLPGTNIFPISEKIARQHINSPNNETLFNFNYISKRLQKEFNEITEIGCLVNFTNFADDQIQFGFEQVEEQTGLYTRHGIMKKLSIHVSRSRRYFNPLSIIMLRTIPDSDVDNDNINHAIAMILKEKLRWVDDVGHWNMSDFLIILPETGEEAANKLARKIKYQLNRFKMPENHKKIPTSIAISSWRKGEDETSLLKRVVDHLNESRYKIPSTSRIS